ncbi:hypothetical protein B2H99_02430 [Morganella morganii]|uniref:ORF6N domain-containing protein n=1 Tax=Morganella morganii TaxID=582 RepID=UPI0009BF6C8B|nr:ORF6N domain-containing protein [Morganella morganii]OQP28764.1 hypothetical protein B2H99_02430 [Morganella morganii]OQP30427.1 hypothetical protein B2I00_09100 [Morganella morganii]
MQAQIVTIDNLSPVIYQNRPVLTSSLLASLYGTDSIRIRQNHSRNTCRFAEGKHFFNLQGTDLKQFKHRVSESYSVLIPKNVSNLTLWTERGAARHAKMLDTDMAWNVFERLEDNYFTKHDEQNSISKSLPRNASTEELLALVDQLQRTIHEGEFIPAGQVAQEYCFPKTKKSRSQIINDFLRSPEDDTLHQLLAYLKRDGHNVEEAERVLMWLRDYMCDMGKTINTIITHAQYIEHAVSKL